VFPLPHLSQVCSPPMSSLPPPPSFSLGTGLARLSVPSAPLVPARTSLHQDDNARLSPFLYQHRFCPLRHAGRIFPAPRARLFIAKMVLFSCFLIELTSPSPIYDPSSTRPFPLSAPPDLDDWVCCPPLLLPTLLPFLTDHSSRLPSVLFLVHPPLHPPTCPCNACIGLTRPLVFSAPILGGW